MNLPNRKRLIDLESKLMVANGKDEGKGQLGIWGWTCTHCCIKWMTNKDLLYSTKNSAQQLCGSLDGRGVWGKMDTCICVAEKMAPHSSTLAWKIPWTEEPGRLQSMGSLRVGHD